MRVGAGVYILGDLPNLTEDEVQMASAVHNRAIDSLIAALRQLLDILSASV